MWREPYLETCCRSALHRLTLCGETGRPAGLSDAPCLERLAALGLACQISDVSFKPTEAGILRHRTEILRVP